MAARRRARHGQVLPRRAARRRRHDQGAGRAVPGAVRPDRRGQPRQLADYLALPAVLAVGGTWMVAPDLIAAGRFDEIARPHRGRCRARRGGRMTALAIRPAAECRYDLVSLGEIMLRLDPGEGRIRTARTFRVWEGGGEYNVARGLRRCFGLRTAVVTALRRQRGRPAARGPDPPGRRRHVAGDAGCPTTGSAATSATGSTSPSAASASVAPSASPTAATPPPQLRPDDVDWEHLFGDAGVRWFHTGGIFAALSETTPDVVEAAMSGRAPARHHRLLRPELPAQPLEGGRRQARAPRRSTAGWPATST